MPPPQTMTMKSPEARDVYLPSPSTARLKIAPHITDVHRPQRMKNITPIGIASSEKLSWDVIAGNLTVVESPRMMPRRTNMMATEPTTESIALLDTFPPIAPPIKRPQSMRNQYIPTIVPATAMQKGLNIVRSADGRCQKVFLR